MLEELSKKDKQWRIFALYICKDKQLADVIVNPMITLDPNLTIKRNGEEVTNEWK